MSKLKERNAENAFRGINMCKSHGGGKNERGLIQNHVISKLSRKDLEDKFCTAIEKNISLKNQMNNKDEKLKLLGTKLLRLTQQQKKESSSLDHYHPLDKVLEEQSFRMEQLQNINKNLNDKVTALKRQICAEKHLLASSKDYRPKQINGNIELQKSNGKLKFDLESLHDEVEKCDEFTHGKKYLSEDSNARNIDDSNDTSNNLDCNLSMDNLSYSNIDTLKDNITIQQMEPTRTHQTKSCVKCVKPKNPTKEVEIQTSFDKGMKIPNTYDDLSQKLAQEHMLVIDLQQQLKSAKLTQRVVDEVEELLKHLNSKSILIDNEIKSTQNKHKSNDFDNLFSLRQELQRERVDLQAQKTMNIQLLSKLSEMQKEIDSLRLKLERLAPVTEDFPISSHRNVSLMIKYDSASSSNHSGLKISEHFDDENSKSRSLQNLKNLQSISQNVTFPISPTSSPVRRNSGVKDIKKVEKSPESLNHVQRNIPQITYKAPEFEVDLKKDEHTSLNVFEIVNPQEIKEEEEEKSIDGATYNISSNGSDTTDGSISSSHSQADANDYLSDGEIPKELSPDATERVPGQKIQLSHKNIESVPIEVMAETTLKAISQEIDLCTKKLLCAQDETECHCDDRSNCPQNISEEIDVSTNKPFCTKDEKECCCDDPANYPKKVFEEISLCTVKSLCAQEENEFHCDDPNNVLQNSCEEDDQCTKKLLCAKDKTDYHCDDHENNNKNLPEEIDMCTTNKLSSAQDKNESHEHYEEIKSMKSISRQKSRETTDGSQLFAKSKSNSEDKSLSSKKKLSNSKDVNKCHCNDSSTSHIKVSKSGLSQKFGQKSNGSSAETLKQTPSKTISKDKGLPGHKKPLHSTKSSDKERRPSRL